jgi:hypothetical protein
VARYGLHARRVAYATFYTEGFSSFVASAAAPIATGWSEPVPGRVYLPLWTTTLFTAHPVDDMRRSNYAFGGGIGGFMQGMRAMFAADLSVTLAAGPLLGAPTATPLGIGP